MIEQAIAVGRKIKKCVLNGHYYDQFTVKCLLTFRNTSKAFGKTQ